MVNPFTEHKWKSACGKTLKAITPVIATVMLMLITVGMVGMTYTWFSNMMTTQTEKNIAIPVGGVQCVNNRVSVIVTNAGANSNITDNDIVVADVNGVNVRNTPFFGGFNTNGLVGYWRFENESADGKYAYDYSSYANTGTLANMHFAGTATSGWSDTCKFGKCLNFDGTNDYVLLTIPVSSSLDIDSDPTTLSAWIKTNTLVAGGLEIVGRGTRGGEGHGINQAGDKINIGYHGGGNFDSIAALTTGIWYHVVGIVNGGNTKIYINGAADTATGGVSVVSSNKDGAIGAVKDSSDVFFQFFNGAIDEVMVWNRALTPDEVTQLNKTNSGNFTMAPNRAITLINRYPVSAKGKYTVRVGTRNGVIERTVDCL